MKKNIKVNYLLAYKNKQKRERGKRKKERRKMKNKKKYMHSNIYRKKNEK